MIDYSKVLSQSVQKVKPSGIRKYFDIVSEMKDAISLGVGEPDFVTSWNIREAAIYSIEKGHTHYTSNWGMIELRTQIAKYLSVQFGLSYNPADEVFVTVGASEGIDVSLRALLNPGDEVLLPDPSYVSYAPGIEFAHGIPVPIKTYAQNGFKLTYDAVKQAITPKTKVLILPYPNNPTGGIMAKEDLAEIARALEDTDIIVISDEIYAELTYDGSHVSFASLPNMHERTIVLNGFSKAFAMTGWRIGYLAAPAQLVQMMVKIHQYSIMCASTNSQYAALEALRSGFEDNFAHVRFMTREYDRRRRFLVDRFNEMGLACFEPLGAFYVFPSIQSTNMTSEQFCDGLLFGKHVACVPGTAFGESGEGFIRCSYATSMEKLIDATRLIEEYVNEIK